jgi:hypothetical protein
MPYIIGMLDFRPVTSSELFVEVAENVYKHISVIIIIYKTYPTF